jgi:hypothetical protein
MMGYSKKETYILTTDVEQVGNGLWKATCTFYEKIWFGDGTFDDASITSEAFSQTTSEAVALATTSNMDALSKIKGLGFDGLVDYKRSQDTK